MHTQQLHAKHLNMCFKKQEESRKSADGYKPSSEMTVGWP